jgi:signal transduction histidine kinase
MAWNLGRLAAVRRARALIERAESARVAVLEERARIARETHDIVAHSLAVIVRQAEGGAFVAERDPARAAQALQTIAEAGRVALTDMRGVLGVLREQEPGPSPRPTLADLAPLVAGVHKVGMHAELTESGVPFALSATTELAVYRLVQEGLTNAVKHAGSRARVAVRCPGRCRCRCRCRGLVPACRECASGSPRWAGRSPRCQVIEASRSGPASRG